jgi:hypothetical protein
VFTDPCFVAAGDTLAKIVAAEPFNGLQGAVKG